MVKVRSYNFLLLGALLLVISNSKTNAQEDAEDFIEPQTVGVYGNTTSLFQTQSSILLPDRREKEIYPFYQYLDLNVASPRHNFFSSTYLRGRNIFEGQEESLDVYNAYIDFSNIKKSIDVRLGRQVISESVNYILLDGGLLRFRPMSGVELIAYGGYQYKDIQPEPEQPDKDFGLYGFTLKLDQFLGSLISVGYELHDPDDFSSRHFLNLSFNRVVPFTDFADIYSQAEIDIENGNLASLISGMGITLSKIMYLNLEYTTYEMDEDDDEYKLDPIFDLFSDGRLHQGKAGITYLPTSYLEVKASYTFSRYDVIDDVTTYGNIAHIGFSWDFWTDHGIRAFNGVYFIDGGDDDYALGMNLDITKEVYRGWEMEFAFAYAYYDKITNQDGSAFSYIIGSEYLIMRNLALRTDLEINTNPDFDDDVRLTLGLSYYFAQNI